MPLRSSPVASSVFGLFGGDFGLKWVIKKFKIAIFRFNDEWMKLYLSRGESRRELASETTRLEWPDSRCASRSSLRYSSPDEKGSGVTRSGVRGLEAKPLLVPSSIHESGKSKGNPTQVNIHWIWSSAKKMYLYERNAVTIICISVVK